MTTMVTMTSIIMATKGGTIAGTDSHQEEGTSRLPNRARGLHLTAY